MLRYNIRNCRYQLFAARRLGDQGLVRVWLPIQQLLVHVMTA
jgi:hypothetical protein